MADSGKILLLIPIGGGTDTVISITTKVEIFSSSSSTTDAFYTVPPSGGRPDLIWIDDDQPESEDVITFLPSLFTQYKKKRFKRLLKDFHSKKSKRILKEFSKPKQKLKFTRQRRR